MVPGDGTRPISDRAKQALFNILGTDILDAVVLDLFAGTGSVGIEALSRGAKEAVFVEKEKQAAGIIQANLATVGFTGQAVVHPDKSSGGAAADGGTGFTIQDLTEEGHIWAGGSFDDSMTFFAELTFAPDGVEVEHATVQFADLFGPAHLVNVVVGKGMATLSSFGPHSTYLVDTALPLLPMTALYGATSESFALVNNTNAIEANGTIIGRIDYSVGLAAGANVDVHDSQDVYAHVGYKLGGMSLDAEESEASRRIRSRSTRSPSMPFAIAPPRTSPTPWTPRRRTMPSSSAARRAGSGVASSSTPACSTRRTTMPWPMARARTRWPAGTRRPTPSSPGWSPACASTTCASSPTAARR